MTPKSHWSSKKAATYWDERVCRAGRESVLEGAAPPKVNAAYAYWTQTLVNRFVRQGTARVALDIGAGVGRVVLGPESTNYCVRLDVSFGMLASALKETNSGYVQADVFAMPIRSDSIDLCLCLGVMEHLPLHLHAHAISEIARVLAPGAILILETNNAAPWKLTPLPRNPFRYNSQLSNGYVGSSVNRRTLLRLLRTAGLLCIATRFNPGFSLSRRSNVTRTLTRFLASLDCALGPLTNVLAPVSDQVFVVYRKPS